MEKHLCVYLRMRQKMFGVCGDGNWKIKGGTAFGVNHNLFQRSKKTTGFGR